jgi:hypothetical protein
MKKLFLFVSLCALAFVFTQCSVSRQIKEAKSLGDCTFRLQSIDSVYLAGIDVRELRNITKVSDIDVSRYPGLGLAFLRKNIPLDLRVNLEANNPTKKMAAVQEFEYKVLLSSNEIFSGVVNRRIEIAPGTGRTFIPISLGANAYELFTNDQTRDEFLKMFEALTGKKDAAKSKLTIKIKPTLALGSQRVNYPGYITLEKEITSDMILGENK